MASWGNRIVLAASVVLLAAGSSAVTWAVLNQEPTPPAPQPVGLSASTTQEPASSTVSTADPAEPRRERAAPTATATPENPTEPAVAVMPRSAPVVIEIPAIEVTSPLHPLGLNDDGTLQVPSGDRYDEAAWYDGSPTPGELGPAIIEGHVTSAGATPSVFFELGALGLGDRIRVTREDDSVAVFEVYATDSFPKDEFPTAVVYGNTDQPELRLITCGGDYDAQARAHVDNVVVFARLVETS